MNWTFGIIFIFAITFQAIGFEAGKIDRGFSERFSVSLPENTGETGTIQFWVHLKNLPADNKKLNFIASAGLNKPGWFFLGMRGSELCIGITPSGSLLYQPPAWTSGQWYNLAITWGNAGEKGYMLLYIDGILKTKKIHKDKIAFVPFNKNELVFNGNSAGGGKNDIEFILDEIYISRIPLSPQSILNNYRDNLQGKSAGCPDIEIRLPLNGSTKPVIAKQKPIDELQMDELVLKNLIRPMILKYENQITGVRYDHFLIEKEKGGQVLTDGNEDTWLTASSQESKKPWEVIFEFPMEYDLEEVEVVATKVYKAYYLGDIFLWTEDEDGKFIEAGMLTTWPKTWSSDPNVPNIDADCKKHYYTFKNINRKTRRVKFSSSSNFYKRFNEFYFRGVPANKNKQIEK